MTLLLLCFSIIFPILGCFLLYHYRERFEKDRELKEKYGAIYEEYKSERWYEYMHMGFFCFRRTLVVIDQVFLWPWPTLQLIVFQIINLSVRIKWVKMNIDDTRAGDMQTV